MNSLFFRSITTKLRKKQQGLVNTHPITATCLASSFNLQKLSSIFATNLIKTEPVHHTLFLPAQNTFVFPESGAVVSWSKASLPPLKAAFETSYAPEEDDFIYSISDVSKMDRGCIMTTNDVLDKLAYSEGLARSVRLNVLETQMEEHLLELPSPQTADEKILRLQTSLFKLRSLNMELLDPPGFCWESHDMENTYESISRYLDIRSRVQNLNKKLDYASEWASLIKGHRGSVKGVRLEWIIIWLIMAEVLFHLIEYAERFGIISLPDERAHYKVKSVDPDCE